MMTMTPARAGDSKEVEDFITKAHAFCDLIENEEIEEVEFLNRIYRILPDLYLAGLELPEIELESEEETETDEGQIQEISARISERIPRYGTYWKVFDPIYPEDKEPVRGFLADDLADIYRNLKRGLLAFQEGTPEALENSLWELRFGFRTHWGRHLIDALRALHYLVHDHMGGE